MELVVGYHTAADPARRTEYELCLAHNAANACFDAVHVLIEDRTPPGVVAAVVDAADRHRLQIVEHRRRITFAEVFDYVNALLAGRHVVLANADIHFDESLAALSGRDLFGEMLRLSRWDVQPDGTSVRFDHPASQDAWIFEPPLPPIVANFHLGVLGCDNRVAAEAARAGLAVSNPSRTIVAHHVHTSDVHTYTPRQRLGGELRNVPADTLAPARERVYALTSLPPAADQTERTAACIASWRRAGLRVVAFNHPDEIGALRQRYDVAFVPVTETTEAVFGRPFVPIWTMLDWARRRDVAALVVNADIELDLAPWELDRLRLRSAGGLCWIVRHNHDGDHDRHRAEREPDGIDAFLLHGRDAALFEPSSLSMGQPFWDYWLPHSFAGNRRPLTTPAFPVAYHRCHANRWSWEHWHQCGIEMARITPHASRGLPDPARDCQGFARAVRDSFAATTTELERTPMQIRQWVEATFDGDEPKLFLELGAHCGDDTAWLAAIPNVRLHAFEPDPRNGLPVLPNVTVHRVAVSDRDGCGTLIQSAQGWGRPWTYSSSIRRPKHHLDRYPVTFAGEVEVALVTLDTFCADADIDVVDFIWADIQGAEGDMIRGGQRTLARTRYLYTEWSDDELYEGQASLTEILRLLPGFRVVELWSDDVLLENTRFSSR